MRISDWSSDVCSSDLAVGDPLHIPHTLSDRPQAQAHPLVGLFLSLLGLRDARRTASEVRDLLAVPQVMAAFDLSDADLDRIDDWFSPACLAWGEDQTHPQAVGMGRWREQSFAFGLARLLHAHPPRDSRAATEGPPPCATAPSGDPDR